MKKLSIALFIIVLITVVAVFSLPHVVSVEWVSEQVKANVKDKTGRDIDFKSIETTVWPNIGLKLTDVVVSNANWAKENYLFSVDTLDVVLAIKPLIQKRIELKRAIIENPIINLEVDPSGRQNWDIPVSTSKNDAGGRKSVNAKKAKGEAFDFSFGDLKIINAEVNFADAKNGNYETINNANIALIWPNINSLMSLESSFIFRRKEVNANLKLLKPIDFIKGKVSAGDIYIASEDNKIKAAGMFSIGEEYVDANVETNIKDIKEVIDWLNIKGGIKKLPIDKLYMAGEVKVKNGVIHLNKISAVVDDIKANGDVKIAFAEVPNIYARLSTSKIKLDEFLKSDSDAVVTSSREINASDLGDWKRSPIDFSFFKNFDLDLIIKTEGFSLRGVKVGESDLTVRLKGGNFNFKSTEASLLRGKLSSDLTLNVYSSVPTMAANFNMQDVEVNEIFTNFMDFENLRGAVDANISIRSSGINEKEIISNLEGDGNATFKDGILEGIDLTNIAKLVKKRVNRMNINEGETPFGEIKTVFTISGGIIYTNDLKLKGPNLKASGIGSIYLPKKYLDFRITPVLLSDVGIRDNDLLSVPVKIKGYFHKIRIKPEYRAIVEKIVSEPEKVKGKLKDIEKKVKVIKKDLKKIIKEEIKNDPVKAIRGLFGSIFGGSKEKKSGQ